ncbi:MAG: hypothetical protein PWQ35_608 [Patescibacteria group bacterium]|nr:hypothetical protein [Patescibacteria group bacterium]
MIFTMFILAGMLIVAISGAYLISVGITAAGVQMQSTRAYFAAESGSERILWEFRKNGADYGTADMGTGVPILEDLNLGENLSFQVFHNIDPNTLHNYRSVGSSGAVKRSVEISF